MSLVNVVKATLAVAVVAAVGYAGYKTYKEEIEPQRRKTEAARDKAKADIAAARAQTEEVRKASEASMAETLRKSAEDDAAHQVKMEELRKLGEKYKEEAEAYNELWERHQAGDLTTEEWIKASEEWRKTATLTNADKPRNATIHDIRRARKCS